MEIKEFINARFLVPPTIFLFFLFLANPDKFVLYIESHDKLTNLIFAPSIIFAFGFLISTAVTAFYINPLRLRQTIEDTRILEKVFPFLKESINNEYNDTQKEISTWLTILDDSDQKLDYLREQIHKRWHAFNAGMNAIASLLLLLIYVMMLQRQTGWSFWSVPLWGYIWPLLITISIIAFYFAGQDAYNSVKEIDNIMIRRKEYIIQREKSKRSV